jgi:hypothetical protein
MELNDLKALIAATLLGGSVRTVSHDGGRTSSVISPTAIEITTAVQAAQRIWNEVIKQDREGG